MATLTTTITLDKVLSSIGVSNSEFMAAWVAEETQLRNTQVPSARDKLTLNSMIPQWLKRIDETTAIIDENKLAYKKVLINWRDEIITNVSPTALPEQGTKFVTDIVDKTEAFFDDIISGVDDVSKIGFYDIPELDDPRGFPVIVPSSINIQEHLLNQPVPTVRSKSVAVVPNHRSKHTVSIDIIFPNFETFSSTKQDYPSFINLYHMFKFMPINSIYSSALCTAFINEFTFPKLFNVVNQMYASDAIIGDTYEEKLDSLFKKLDTDNLNEIKGLFQSDNPDLDIGLTAIFDSIAGIGLKGQTGRGWNLSEFDSDGQDNGPIKFPVPVCFKSASVQTLDAMPGAILGRFSFGIINSPAFPYGAITYRDISGKRTLDPDQCYWGKRYVSLASKNLLDKKDEDLYNVRHIGESEEAGASDIRELTNNDIRLYYIDIHSSSVISFDTTSTRYIRTDNQSPVVLEKMSAVFNSKTVDIPLIGSQFPTVQYMGMNSSSFQIILAVTDKKIISDFMAMKAQIVDAEKSQYMLSSFGYIENPLINSLGISRVTPQSVTIESDPDSPDLYRLIINFVENVQDIDTSGGLQLEKGGMVQSSIDDIWDYLYDLYKIWAVSQGIITFRDPKSGGLSNPHHLTMLNTLMSVLGSNEDTLHIASVLNPTAGEHGTTYGTLLMGIIAQLIQEQSGEKELRPTGNLEYDFPELVAMRVGFWRSRLHEALVNIAFGSIRADEEGTTTLMGAGHLYFEIDRDEIRDSLEGKQQTIFSKALHKVLFGVDYDDPFVHKNEDFKDAWDNITEEDVWWGNWLSWKFGAGKNTEENDYYALRENISENQYINDGWRYDSYMDILDLELPDFDDTLYGVQHTFAAKNLLDIWHTQGKVLPKSIWDNVLKSVVNREHTEVGSSNESLVHFESTDQSFSILYNLITQHQNLYEFNRRKDSNGIEWIYLQAYGMEAKLNVTKIKREQEQIEQFEDTRVDMYPDLTLPTYEELFSSAEIEDLSAIGKISSHLYGTSKPRGPWDVFDPSVVRNNLMEVFAPKCGDKGVLPSKIKYIKLMRMTIADISDTVASDIEDFIDPDIFYWRNRDKQLIAEAVATSDADSEAKIRGATFYLPINESKFYDNAVARTSMSALNDGNKNVLELHLQKEKFIKDYAKAIATSVAMTANAKSSGSAHKDFRLRLKEELKDVGIELSDADTSLSEIEKYYRDALTGKTNAIEFVTSDGFLILTLVRDAEGRFYAEPRGRYSKPMYYSPISDMSIGMLNEKTFADIHEQQLAHSPDLIESALRSFPTIRLYFIEEDREQVHYRDDFYGFSDIVECSISSNIYDADVCTMKLANFGGILSSQSFTDRATSNIRVNKNDPSKSIRNTKPEDTELVKYVDDAGGKFLRSILLRPGVHIMVKMGYGNNVNHLKTVFTGEIAEVKSGSVVEIIAQGFQTELQYDFGGFMQEDWLENFRHWLPSWIKDSPYKFGFLKIINFILLGDLENGQRLNRKGTPHLGKQIIAQPYRKGGPFGSVNSNWGYSADNNVIQTHYGYSTATDFLHDVEGGDPWTTAQLGPDIFNPAFLESNYFGFKGYDLSRNIYSAEANCETINKTNEYLVTTGPVMDGLREVVRYMPNFIATVVPFEQDATLFIGDPAGPYEFRKPTDDERKYSTIVNNAHKAQKSLFDLNGKYNILANAINRKSTLIRDKITRHNRTKVSELLNDGDIHASKITFESDVYAILDGYTVRGSDGIIHAPKWEDEDLEELCQNLFYNPASGVRVGGKDKAISLSDDVHANLFAMYLGISLEDTENSSASLASISKEIGAIHFDSRDQLGDEDIDDLYDIGGISREFIREEYGINRLYPLIVSSQEEYNKVRNSTKNTSVGTVVDLNLQSPFISTVAETVQNIFKSYDLSDIKVNNNMDESPVKLLSFIDIMDRTSYRSFGVAQSAQDHKNKRIAHDFWDYPMNFARLTLGLGDIFDSDTDTIQSQLLNKVFGDEERGGPGGNNAFQGALLLGGQDKLNDLGDIDRIVGVPDGPGGLLGFFMDKALLPVGIIPNTIHLNQLNPILLKIVFEYKQFLMLADEALNGTDPTEQDANLREIMVLEDSDKITMPFYYKIFRDTHIVSSTHDLIANNLTVSRSDMWSAINLRVPKDTVSEVAGLGEYGPFAYGIDEPGWGGWSRDDTVFRIQPGQDFATYPGHGSSGVNYRGTQPGPRDIVEPFTEINATSPELAMRVMQNRIAQGLSKMYRGNLIMLGRNIKPYDKMIIVDDVNNMYGTVMVERVIQNFSAVNGWTTTIVPSALTIENSTLATYDAKWWQRLLFAIGNGRTFGAVMDIITVASFAIPPLGGGVVAAQVGLNSARALMWAPFKIVAGMWKGAGTWASVKAATRVFTHGGKFGIGKFSTRLPGIWTAMRTAPDATLVSGRAGAAGVRHTLRSASSGRFVSRGWNTAENLGNIVIAKNIGRGLTTAGKFMVGRTFVQGSAAVAEEFFSPLATTGSPLFKKGAGDQFGGANFLPAKVSLLRYNGAPFAALPDLYDELDDNGWDGLYTELGYMWREIWATPGSTDFNGNQTYEELNK